MAKDEVSEVIVCERCGSGFARPSNKGPKPRFCPGACRQRAHEGRKESELIALADDIVATHRQIQTSEAELEGFVTRYVDLRNSRAFRRLQSWRLRQQ